MNQHSSIAIVLFMAGALPNLLCQTCLDGETVICPEEQWNSQTSFTWRATCQSSDELIVSSPKRCLDQYKHYVTRTCSSSSGWLPPIGEIDCPYDIDENTMLNTCPPNFDEAVLIPGFLNDVKICVYMVPPGYSLEAFCLQTGSSLTLDEIDADSKLMLFDHVSALHGSPIYLPASKLWYNRLTELHEIDYSFQWIVAGKYGKNVNLRVEPEKNAKGCIYTDLSNINQYFFSEDCSIAIPQICLYDQQQPTMLQLSCPEGYKTTRYRSNYFFCYKIQKFENAIQRDELTDDYVRDNICTSYFPFKTNEQLNVFRALSRDEHLTESDRCLFMNSLNGKMIITEEEWTLSDIDKIDFVNWSLNATLSAEDSPAFDRSVLVAGSNGEWTWDDGVITCAFCNLNGGFQPDLSLELEMDADGNLVAFVENENWWWKENESASEFSCYSLTLESRNVQNVRLTPIVRESYVQKRYRLQTSGTGRYWCSGLQAHGILPAEADFDYKIPMKFAVLVRPQSSGQTPDQFFSFIENLLDSARYQVFKTALQPSPSSSSFIHLYHVSIIAVTDEFLNFEENKIGLNERMLIAYYIQRHLNEIRLITSPQTDFHILSLNSTEFCLPPSISELEEFNWPGARIGQSVNSDKFCLLATNGLPVTRRCIGDDVFGAVWMETIDNIECKNSTPSAATSQLHKLSLLHISSVGITNIIDQLEDIVFELNYSEFIAPDIFYVSQIMLNIQHSVVIYPLQRDYVSKVLRIYNQLLMVDEDVMYETSSLNTTNVLLDAIDVIVADFATYEMAMSNDAIMSFQFDEPLLSTFIFNPKYTNFTGIIATNRTSQLTIEYVNQFQKIENILNVPDLIVASYVPAPLLQHLQNPLIIASLFVNDVLFHSYNASDSKDTSYRSGGAILSLTLPGTDHRLHKINTLPIFIKPDQTRSYQRTDDDVCGFWSFSPAINGWDTHGCQMNRKLVTADVVLCECDHLTHFAYLVYGDTPIDLKYFDTLEMLTFIACSISLAGLFGIFLSALLFRSWRSTMSTKYLLQMSTALALELIMMLFVSTEDNARMWIEKEKFPICVAMGAVLHYSVLVTWMWMFVIGYMQYMRYVVVFHSIDSSRVFIASSFIGWGIPMIPVAFVLLINYQSYVPAAADHTICYPSGYALYFTLVTPIAIITAANFVILVVVIKSLRGVGLKQETRAMILSKLRLSIFLFFVLGLTWTFSFLSRTNAGVVFSYLFCATATLQGFVLFFYFVILDPTLRGLWVALCWKRK